MLEIMRFYRKTVHLAPMRGISWQVVEFTGKKCYMPIPNQVLSYKLFPMDYPIIICLPKY